MCADIQASPLRGGNDSMSNFSPVTVRESPVRQTPQRGNLTGNPRKVRDLAADLYNLIQKWNSCHSTGADILAKISQLKLTVMDGIPQDELDLFPEGIQKHCDELEKVYKEMSDIAVAMKKCVEQFKAIGDLEKYQKNMSEEGVNSVNPLPMFLTWPAERFGEVASEIVSCYTSELEVKEKVLEGVCHCESRETLMFHVAAWVHQPTINENETNSKLEALLLETGHR